MTAILKVDTIQDTSGNNIINESSDTITIGASGDTVAVPSGGKLTAPGHVLQVKQTTKTDSFSTNSTSMVDITGFSVSITPNSTSNKILVMVNAGILSNSGSSGTLINLLRDSTNLISNTSGGSADTYNAWNVAGGGGMTNNDRKYNASPSITYLDSPSSTSSLTYKCQLCVNGGSTYAYLNQWSLNTDNAAVSTITVMEIAG